MKQNMSIIGVPMDLGQNRRGVDMGPSAIRYAGVTERLENLQYHISDLGNVPVSVRTGRTKYRMEICGICSKSPKVTRNLLNW